MRDPYHPLLLQLARESGEPIPSALQRRSAYFTHAIGFNLDNVAGPTAAGSRKGPTLGRFFDGMKPSPEGIYRFEIGTRVPYFLPRLEGDAEYVLMVDGRSFVVCLRLNYCYGVPKGSPYVAQQYLLAHSVALPQLSAEAFESVHTIPFGTYVSSVFEGKGKDAEDALEGGFIAWSSQLSAAVGRIVGAIRTADRDIGVSLPVDTSFVALPHYWVTPLEAEGEPHPDAHPLVFAATILTATHKAIDNLAGEGASALRARLSSGASGPVHAESLALARAFLHHGMTEQSILSMAVAAEAFLSERYLSFLAARGASKTKIGQAKKDITFSQLLNLHTFAMLDPARWPDFSEVVGRVDTLRDWRNQVAHEGRLKRKLSLKEVEGAFEAVERLIGYFDVPRREPGAPAPEPPTPPSAG